MRRLLPVVVLPVLLAAAGCGGDSGTASAGSSASSEVDVVDEPVTQPQTEAAARKVAQEHADTYSAGDYEGTWELWSNKAKQVLDQDGYVRLFELCPQIAEGVPMKVENVRLNADKTAAVVRIERATFKFTYRYAYENGRWVFVPDAKTLADYRLGPDKLAAKRKAEGACG